jgi:hypothetical protein
MKIKPKYLYKVLFEYHQKDGKQLFEFKSHIYVQNLKHMKSARFIKKQIAPLHFLTKVKPNLVNGELRIVKQELLGKF